MASSNSPKNQKLAETNQDLISNLPSIVTDKILKRLPLSMAAKMSLLSRKWRQNWLSHGYLVFDKAFWEGRGVFDKAFWEGRGSNGINTSADVALLDQKVYNIINNLLFHHNGPLHKFHLYIPIFDNATVLHLSQWLSFLSRTCVKNIALVSRINPITMPSHIFVCKELVKLRLDHFFLNPPPCDFKGFPYLRVLELVGVYFKTNFLESLLARCPRLTELRLLYCFGMNHLVIDVPSLENFVIRGVFETLHFKSFSRLNSISLDSSVRMKDPLANETFDSIKFLANSCKIQYLEIGGHFSKLLDAVGVTKLLPLAFNHLNKLCLKDFDLGDPGIFRFASGMVHSCPCIKNLEISFATIRRNTNVTQYKIDMDNGYKLEHLLKMKITGITGSSAELKFIEYVLSISVALETFFFKCK